MRVLFFKNLIKGGFIVNIAVCVKQVPDTETKVKIKDDKKWIKEDEINFILNPYDELGVEEGLKLKEANGGEVTIISLGPDRISSTIRSALAMGADKAIRIKSDKNPLDPAITAAALAEVLKEGNYDIIITGKQAIDDDHAQMAALLSEILNIPAITVVTKLEIDGNKVTAYRQVEGGFEKIECNLPLIISAQKGLNEPRYASLKGIMAAKRITIEEKMSNLQEDKIDIVEINYPPQKPPGRIVGQGPEAVPELIRLLREEAKII
jgi:electron transfer flavoprotein beta subunit